MEKGELSIGTSKVRLYINGTSDGSSDTAMGPVQSNSISLQVGRY